MTADELRCFLRDCFAVTDTELFVGHGARLDDDLRDVGDEVRFAAFCTYEEGTGDFAMRLSVGIEGRLVARVDRLEFARRFAARFDSYLLYGDNEPEPWLWTVIRPDGDRLYAVMAGDEDRLRLEAASGPISGLPRLRVDPRLGPPTYGRWYLDHDRSPKR
ncbi:hypothetical protein [Plantactinospora sp. GCM10030261]|uniref:hypothetical protein n=1 Tax=Plantactinospora sp. GCM10030261 TaxID=3273420 RepID=UPI003605F93D